MLIKFKLHWHEIEIPCQCNSKGIGIYFQPSVSHCESVLYKFSFGDKPRPPLCVYFIFFYKKISSFKPPKGQDTQSPVSWGCRACASRIILFLQIYDKLRFKQISSSGYSFGKAVRMKGRKGMDKIDKRGKGLVTELKHMREQAPCFRGMNSKKPHRAYCPAFFSRRKNASARFAQRMVQKLYCAEIFNRLA